MRDNGKAMLRHIRKMGSDDATTIAWLEPWNALSPGAQEAMERELQRELTEGHPLYQATARAMAQRSDDDDVLFMVINHPHPFAVVHLIWQGPQCAPWPHTRFYDSLEVWMEECMKPAHGEYIHRVEM